MSSLPPVPPTQSNAVVALRNLRLVDVEVATRATLAGGIPLVILLALGHMELASYAAFGALTAIYGRNEPYRHRIKTLLRAGAMLATAIALGLVLAVNLAPVWVVALVVLLTLAAGVLTAQIFQFIPPTAIFPVMAVLIVSQIHTPADQLVIRLVVTLASITFAIALSMVGFLGRAAFPGVRDGYFFKPLVKQPQVRWHLIGNREMWIIILLNSISIVLAGAVALALGIGHPYWAVLAVVAVVPAPFMRLSLRRGVQRMVGTIAGVGIMAVVFAFHPSNVALIVVWAVCQFITEILISQHYGIALLFVTPLVLAITELGTPAAADVVLFDRVIQTVVGAALTMGVLWLYAQRKLFVGLGAKSGSS